MNKKLKMLPAFLMLAAGAVTSIITYLLHYEGKTALKILLGVLLLFYIIGFLFQKMILRFEKQVEQAEKEKAEKEGVVVEKDTPQAAGETAAPEETDKTDKSVEKPGEQQNG